MNKENMVYIHNIILFKCKENEIGEFTDKWMGIEKLYWVPPKKEKHTACSLSNVDLNSESLFGCLTQNTYRSQGTRKEALE